MTASPISNSPPATVTSATASSKVIPMGFHSCMSTRRRFVSPMRDREQWTAVNEAIPVEQSIVVLDLEGVLVPEIWIAIAERTGVAELRRTTRDEPDYNLLMKGRLDLLDRHGLTMSAIADVIAELRPLEGAREFLDTLRARTQVVLLSDTFEQFGGP